MKWQPGCFLVDVNGKQRCVPKHQLKEIRHLARTREQRKRLHDQLATIEAVDVAILRMIYCEAFDED